MYMYMYLSTVLSDWYYCIIHCLIHSIYYNVHVHVLCTCIIYQESRYAGYFRLGLNFVFSYVYILSWTKF